MTQVERIQALIDELKGYKVYYRVVELWKGDALLGYQPDRINKSGKVIAEGCPMTSLDRVESFLKIVIEEYTPYTTKVIAQ